MKHKVISAVLAAGLVAGSLPLFAQTATEQQNQSAEQQSAQQGHWRHRRGDHMQKLAQKLNLSQQQQDQLKPMMQQSREQAKAIRDDASLTPDQKKEKLQALREQTKSQINSALTPDQQQQMAKLREEGKARMTARRQQFGKRMAEKLNLSQQQQDQLKPIFEKRREQAKSIWQDNSLSQDQKREKMQALRQDTQAQLNQILTPEQQQQLQQIREQRKGRRHHGGAPDGQATQPQPQGA